MRTVDADVLIAGGGLAAQRCSQTLRRHGFDGRIVVLCQESEPPYDRPPLSKGVLTEPEPRALAYRPARWYADQDIRLLLATEATELHADTRTLIVREHGARRARRIRYRELVVATGSGPRRLPGLPVGGRLHELRTHSDAMALRAVLAERPERLAVIGAGLIGMEVASSACELGIQVTLIEAGATPLGRALPTTLGQWMADLHRRHGIDVRLSTAVDRLSRSDGRARLALSDGTRVDADAVLVAVGTTPATEWLVSGGLGAGPIPVDAAGRTTLADVYAAGDAACFPDATTGERIATPHWEAAARQGEAVARAIAGLPAQPVPPPMFWSDQHGHRIQVVGHAPADSEIDFDGPTADGEPFAAWVTHRGRPVAALLVDRPALLPTARDWIATSREERLSA